MKGAAPADAQSVLDFAGLRKLQGAAHHKDPEALKQAARQFESLFMQQILKSMRATLPGDALVGGEQGKIYRDMLDQQLVQNLSQGRGLGLAEMLVRQLGAQSDGKPAANAPASHPVARPLPAASAPVSDQHSHAGGFEQARQFISSLLPAAREVARSMGVSPRAVLAHAALETGWGRRLPQDGQGGSSFNLFGIKAAGGWDGDSVRSRTQEFVKGVAQVEQAAFRAYENLADSVRDYGRFLEGNKRYKGLMGVGDDIAAYASGLQRAGYATDPHYAAKFMGVAQGKLMREVLHSLGAEFAN